MSRCTHEGCNTPIRKGLKKCIVHLKGKRKATVLRPSRKGMNATGIAAHKPDRSHTRKAKRQNRPTDGPRPVTAYHMDASRARATKADKENF